MQMKYCFLKNKKTQIIQMFNIQTPIMLNALICSSGKGNLFHKGLVWLQHTG